MDQSWDNQSFQTISSAASLTNTAPSTSRFSRSQRSPSPPPFGLDFDPWASNSSRASTASSTARSTASRGFRDGGPKESRLKRVAFLSMTKEVDHLFPVKIKKVGKNVSAEKIAQDMSQYGEVGDVYVPISHTTLQPTGGFAVVRFTSRDAVDRLLEEEEQHVPHQINGEPVVVAPVSPQRSFFSTGTGFHGICNVPVDDGTYIRGMPIPEQNIPLSSCLSRSGYPWGSVRELKFLAPHAPVEKLDGFALKVMNLPHHLTEEQLYHYFARFGEVLSVSCPKPILVVEKVADSNCGVCWVKYEDKRDMEKAYKAICNGEVVFDGRVVEAKAAKPNYWPTEETRRYY